MNATGRLGWVRASRQHVVGTSYDGRPFSVVVADRETLRPEHVLEVRDRQGAYSNGALRVLAARDDGTVLLRVVVPGPGRGDRVVAWQARSDDLVLVSSIDAPAEDQVAFAAGLLR
jgi:hypothetical protein